MLSQTSRPSPQYPSFDSSGSVFAEDIWEDQSNINTFTGGSILDLFDNLHTVIVDNSATAIKEIFVHFNRTTPVTVIALGAHTGDFSNVKISALVSGATEIPLIDDSANSTKVPSAQYDLEPIGFNALRIQFHTTDPVSLSNLFIVKATSVSAQIQGKKTNGEFTNIGATNNNNLKISVQEYGDTPAIDAFGRLRTSEPYTVFDSKQLHDKQPLFWDETKGGSATSVHSPVDANTAMTVTANAADYVIRQTKQRFNYQPGKSQLIFMTFYSPQVAGVTNRIGAFDGIGVNYLTPNNGIFFECDGDLSWNIAKNGTITENITQANWNVDKLDGTGASGITLDVTATQILAIDYEWLGVGRVRVGFVIDGLVYYVHHFNHSNDPSFSSVYMSSPNLPLRFSIETDGTNGSTLDHICCSVMSEGGLEKTGILRVADTGDTYITSLNTGASYALVGIRLKTTYKDITVIPEAVSLFLGTSDSFKWSLQLNPVIAGTFTYADLANSAVQNAVGAATNTISTKGLLIGAGGGSNTSKQTEAELKTALKIGTTIVGVQDELVLVITPFSTNLSAWAGLTFRELL